MTPARLSSAEPIAVESDALYPLTFFRQMRCESAPDYTLIDGDEMPEPYRSLLVHGGDMTSRLEAFHGGGIILELLNRERTASAYRREVVLHVEETYLPVEYGAIEIELGAFEPELRAKILEEHLPLGGLLNRFRVKYHSEPRAFFKLGADPEMNRLFGLQADEFFGRSNELVSNGIVLARIIEVLRPETVR